MRAATWVLATALWGLSALPVLAKTIDIAIGHQSLCTDTYTAGIIVKERHLLEKHLPHTGKYAGVKYHITWNDYSSGGPITNEMLAGKLNFGVMGDYPLIVNGAQFQATHSLRTLYVSGTGYNLKGSGNGIVVPIKSHIYSLSQLRGRTVSTPVGSASWGMLVKALADLHMSLDSVELENQSPAVGAANIQAGKVDAHADFCPWPQLMVYRGYAREIYDGSETDVPYLHGLVVRKDFAEKYPQIVVAFIEAIIDAGNWVNADPLKASREMAKWTGVEKEVLYLYFSKGGLLTLDPTIKPQWVKTLEYDHQVLVKANLSPPLDFNKWIDDSFIKRAYAEMGLDYQAQLKKIVDPAIVNRGLPDEIWQAKKGITTYPSVKEFLAAVARLEAAHAKLNATYVYDQKSGLKLFGNMAFYVRDPKGDYAAFLLRDDAKKYAAKVKGTVLPFAAAVRSATS